MENLYLDNIWNSIVYQGKSDFEFRRIDTICVPELSLGLNSKLNRCLILELPQKNNVDLQSSLRENISIEFFRDTNYIVIELTGNNYYDLFNDLIISLYHRIKSMNDADTYSSELISTYYKWSEFFMDSKSDKLSMDFIKGLFGELIVLKSMLLDSSSFTINDALKSWVGPYDKGHDFELDNRDLEVKTKDASKLDVRISSEYQLQNQFGKALELVVVSVTINPQEGISIREIIIEIKDIVNRKLGDSSILLKAIGQKGLTMKNINSYDNFRFRPTTMVSYSCDAIQFPKLVRTDVPKEIFELSYNLRVSELNTFIITTIQF